jgi:hypothetical protein
MPKDRFRDPTSEEAIIWFDSTSAEWKSSQWNVDWIEIESSLFCNARFETLNEAFYSATHLKTKFGIKRIIFKIPNTDDLIFVTNDSEAVAVILEYADI